MIKVVLFISALSSTTSAAWAGIYCTEPRAPSFYDTKPKKPDVPYCINEFSHTNTCSNYTISAYNSDVDAFNDKLRSYRANANSYIYQLNNYLSETKDYANCEANHL